MNNLQTILDSGLQFSVVDGKLKIVGNADRIEQLKPLIIENKPAIIEAIKRQQSNPAEMAEAECMRIIPMLCQKADERPELQAEISAIIDEFLELERAGDESALLERLKQAESRYRA